MKSTSICTIIILAFSLNLFAGIEEKKTFIYFETDRAELSEESQQILNDIFTQAMNSADFELAIIGHTDSRGTKTYNRDLSLERAASVKDYFLNKGLGELYITSDYKGELDPVKPNISLENMGENRRVEVVLITYAFETIQELEQALVPNKEQLFTVDPKDEKLLTGKHGTRVLIPENAFVDKAGNLVSEAVNVELIEAINYEEFLASGLETKSGDDILVSGGMIKLSASTISGEEVQIDSNKEVFVAVPDDNRSDGMNVFLSDGGQDWRDTERPITNKAARRKAGEFPELKVDKSRLPIFRYPVKAPTEPKRPYIPKEPEAPRVESFYGKIPWYRWNKKKIKAGQKRRYQTAVDRYVWRLKRYDKKSHIYEERYAVYQEKFTAWQAEYSKWEYRRDSLKENFMHSPEYLKVLEYKKKKDDAYLAQYESEVAAFFEEKEAYEARWGKKMARMGIDDTQNLNNYVFTVNQASWINIDRFYKVPASRKQDVVLASEDVTNEKVLIIFKKIKSMLACKVDVAEDVFFLEGLPIQEEKIIFAYKIVDQKPMVCYRPMSGLEEYQLNYRQSSFAEIKQILRQFNKTS